MEMNSHCSSFQHKHHHDSIQGNDLDSSWTSLDPGQALQLRRCFMEGILSSILENYSGRKEQRCRCMFCTSLTRKSKTTTTALSEPVEVVQLSAAHSSKKQDETVKKNLTSTMGRGGKRVWKGVALGKGEIPKTLNQSDNDDDDDTGENGESGVSQHQPLTEQKPGTRVSWGMKPSELMIEGAAQAAGKNVQIGSHSFNASNDQIADENVHMGKQKEKGEEQDEEGMHRLDRIAEAKNVICDDAVEETSGDVNLQKTRRRSSTFTGQNCDPSLKQNIEKATIPSKSEILRGAGEGIADGRRVVLRRNSMGSHVTRGVVGKDHARLNAATGVGERVARKNRKKNDLLPEWRRWRARQVVEAILAHCEQVTKAGRKYMEDSNGKRLPQDYTLYPGKMDHSTCVVFTVGGNSQSKVVIPTKEKSAKESFLSSL